MSFNVTNAVSVGDPTRKSHYDRVFDNALALKEARRYLNLGGADAAVTDIAFVFIPQFNYIEIDGTNLVGLTVEVHAVCRVQSGTGTIDLIHTPGVPVSKGSQTFTQTSFGIVKITPITLETSVKIYALRVKGALVTDLPRVRGAGLVIR